MSSGASSLIVPLHSAVTFEPVGLVTNVFFDDKNCQVRECPPPTSNSYLLKVLIIIKVSLSCYLVIWDSIGAMKKDVIRA